MSSHGRISLPCARLQRSAAPQFAAQAALCAGCRKRLAVLMQLALQLHRPNSSVIYIMFSAINRAAGLTLADCIR
jgi:hypothetical protein